MTARGHRPGYARRRQRDRAAGQGSGALPERAPWARRGLAVAAGAGVPRRHSGRPPSPSAYRPVAGRRGHVGDVAVPYLVLLLLDEPAELVLPGCARPPERGPVRAWPRAGPAGA